METPQPAATNQYEVELKYPVADCAALEAILGNYGVTLTEPVKQLDRYYAHPARDFRATDEALRVRELQAPAPSKHSAGLGKPAPHQMRPSENEFSSASFCQSFPGERGSLESSSTSASSGDCGEASGSPTGQCVLTYKGPKVDTTTKTRREIELMLGGDQAVGNCHQLLEALGFVLAVEVSKRRKVGQLQWRGREFTVSLDAVERLGNFVELELLASEDQRQQVTEAILGLAAELGLSQPERRGYAELIDALSR